VTARPLGTLAALPALAARAQLGDRAALEALLRGLQDPLHAHVRLLVRDADLADDVLQETLLLICRKLGTLREPAWVRAWAYRVATREAVRAVARTRERRTEPIDDATEAHARTDEGELGVDDVELLMRRVDALPASAQLVVRMHYLQEMSQQEIAAALEIPVGTVKSRLAYGLHRLRAMEPR
jgi:RNA polymerase sigma-70 factor (ECF subfamily)